MSASKISPCTLELLTPALSSFSEEREQAGAALAVRGFNARVARGILTLKRAEARAPRFCPRSHQILFTNEATTKLWLSSNEYTHESFDYVCRIIGGCRMHCADVHKS